MLKTIRDVHGYLDKQWWTLRAKYKAEHGEKAMEDADMLINDPWLMAFAQHVFAGTESDDTLMNWFLRELQKAEEDALNPNDREP